MTHDQEPPYATTAAVAGLAREVEALRRAVDQLRNLPAQLDAMVDVVTKLADHVASHSASPAGSAPPTWLALNELDDAEATLTRLIEWMGTVYLRYADAAAGLPECWPWHPDVIEELLWLRHAWLAAYRDQDAPVSAPGDWHDRYRPGVVRRITATAGRCSLENHQPRNGRNVPGGPVVPLESAVAEIAQWWSSRRDGPAPVPTADHLAQAAAYAQRGRGGSRGRS